MKQDAMMTPAIQTSGAISFGPFSLVASERLLTKAGAPVELGARALDVLIALVSRPNEVVGKRDLLSRVWPDVTVEESSLRFQIASLRKALGDGKDGARYIATLPGRGYCFVAPISRSGERANGIAVNFPQANLPGRLNRMVGRDDDVLKLSARLNAARFVTIVGSGGAGKTTVGVAIGHDLSEAFSGAVLFVDLSVLSDPNLVATMVASMLGLSVQSADATPSLIAYLRDKRILLILDTCKAAQPVEAEVQFGISLELQRILDAHDGQSRSIPLRTNALALVDLNGDGGDHGNGVKTGAAPGGLG
jgi:DNA-binding winged helix-turn-helix (wHTH) protein